MKTAIQKTDATCDAVICEVRRTKENLAQAHGFDIRRMAADAHARQAASGHKIVSRAKD